MKSLEFKCILLVCCGEDTGKPRQNSEHGLHVWIMDYDIFVGVVLFPYSLPSSREYGANVTDFGGRIAGLCQYQKGIYLTGRQSVKTTHRNLEAFEGGAASWPGELRLSSSSISPTQANCKRTLDVGPGACNGEESRWGWHSHSSGFRS